MPTCAVRCSERSDVRRKASRTDEGEDVLRLHEAPLLLGQAEVCDCLLGVPNELSALLSPEWEIATEDHMLDREEIDGSREGRTAASGDHCIHIEACESLEDGSFCSGRLAVSRGDTRCEAGNQSAGVMHDQIQPRVLFQHPG